MRWLCLVFASFLIKIIRLKALGGLYLIYLTYDHFKSKDAHTEEKKVDKWFEKYFGQFWGTVIAIEFADLAFSLDNVFAAVAMSSNMIYVIIGCFIGIAAIRFAAQYFIKLVEKFPVLEWVAFGVIGVLGIKLILSYVASFVPALEFINSHHTDIATSVLTILAFLLPIWYSYVKKP